MKILIGVIMSVCFSIIINLGIYKFTEPEKNLTPPPSEKQIEQQNKDQWNRINDNNGRDVSLWVDHRHGVVCYILGSRQYGGISCLPRNQVINLPY